MSSRSWVLGAGGLAVSLVLFACFLVAYAGALHNPQPHAVPIGVVEPRTAAALEASGGAFMPRMQRDLGELKQALRERKIAGGLIGPRLYVASAASFTTSSYLAAAFRQQNPSLQVVDIRPLPRGDSRGVTLFYATLAWVFAGYLGATVMTTLFGPASPGHRRAALRIGGLALMSLMTGLIGALILNQALGAITSNFFGLAGVGALTAFAVAASTSALQSALGLPGTLVALTAFVMLGNSSSGGAFEGTFTPGFWQTIGPWLPSGAAVSALKGAVYFGSTNIGGRLAVLSAYVLVGAVVTVAFGLRRGLRLPETEVAAAAAI